MANTFTEIRIIEIVMKMALHLFHAKTNAYWVVKAQRSRLENISAMYLQGRQFESILTDGPFSNAFLFGFVILSL